MLSLPKSTEFSKRIPKQKFYDNLDISPSLKKSFVEQIQAVYWRNKLAPSTINLNAGERVTELEVFEIELTSQELDEAVLRQIDKQIPYHILFVLSYRDKSKLIACFDSNLTEEIIKAIAQQRPYYYVMRDSSMANDSVATNFEQIFATYSPDTDRKVL